MLKSLMFKWKTKNITLTVSDVICLVFLGTALLSLKTPTRENLFPYASYLMLALQVGLPLILLPRLRWCLGKVYNGVMFIFLLFALLFLFACASGIWSNMPELELQRSFMIFVPILLIGLLIWADSKPLVTFIRVAKSLVFFVSTLAVVGLLLYFFGSESQFEGTRVQTLSLGPVSLSQNVFGTPPFLRISSLTGNPNSLAMWLLLSLPLTLYLIHIRKIGFVSGKILLVLQLFALILTFSRAGIGSTLLALAAYYYWSAIRFAKKLQRFLFVILIIVTVIGCILMFGFEQFDSQRFSVNLNERNAAWVLLTNAFIERPLFGVGFGVSYETVLEPFGLEISSHNVHLQTLAEIGVFGYLLVLILWLFPLRKSLIGLRNVSVKEQRLALVVSASMLVSLFAHQFFEGSLLRYGFYTLFWAYLLFVGVHPRLKGRT